MSEEQKLWDTPSKKLSHWWDFDSLQSGDHKWPLTCMQSNDFYCLHSKYKLTCQIHMVFRLWPAVTSKKQKNNWVLVISWIHTMNLNKALLLELSCLLGSHNNRPNTILHLNSPKNIQPKQSDLKIYLQPKHEPKKNVGPKTLVFTKSGPKKVS